MLENISWNDWLEKIPVQDGGEGVQKKTSAEKMVFFVIKEGTILKIA